jgi:hypothetical protein
VRAAVARAARRLSLPDTAKRDNCPFPAAPDSPLPLPGARPPLCPLSPIVWGWAFCSGCGARWLRNLWRPVWLGFVSGGVLRESCSVPPRPVQRYPQPRRLPPGRRCPPTVLSPLPPTTLHRISPVACHAGSPNATRCRTAHAGVGPFIHDDGHHTRNAALGRGQGPLAPPRRRHHHPPPGCGSRVRFRVPCLAMVCCGLGLGGGGGGLVCTQACHPCLARPTPPRRC